MKFSKKSKTWSGIFIAQIISFYLISFWRPAVAYAERLFEVKKHFHQSLFAGIHFSAGDVIYLIVLAAIIIWMASSIKRLGAISGGNFLIAVNVLYFLYQIFWGLLYSQTPIKKKLPDTNISVAKAKILTKKYLAFCKNERAVAREDRNGVFKICDLSKVERAILSGQNRLPPSINSKKFTGIQDFKPSLIGGMMSYSGILGYYNPFTAEAQYDPNAPSSSLPFTLAHESAHQLGYAREQEANFIGFLICKNSMDSDLEYSADYFALKSLLAYIASEDVAFVKNTVKNYSPQMKRDRLYERIFIKRYEGFADRFFAATNDLFLKSNRQDGSISYSYFTELLLKYENP